MLFRLKPLYLIFFSITFLLIGLVFNLSFNMNVANSSKIDNQQLTSQNIGATQLYLPLALNGYPGKPTIFGTQTNNGTVSPLTSALVNGHLSWVRYDNLLWSEVEAVQGERDWTKLDLFEREITS